MGNAWAVLVLTHKREVTGILHSVDRNMPKPILVFFKQILGVSRTTCFYQFNARVFPWFLGFWWRGQLGDLRDFGQLFPSQQKVGFFATEQVEILHEPVDWRKPSGRIGSILQGLRKFGEQFGNSCVTNRQVDRITPHRSVWLQGFESTPFSTEQ